MVTEMKYFNNDNILKILSIIAFASITVSVLIINFAGTANGYEISIYNAYPVYLWFFIILAMLCGIILLVYHSFNEKKSNLWIVGLLALILTNVIILLLPLFRDYFVMGSGDVLTHIGFAKDIINTGHFEAGGTLGENLYPILHITMVTFYYSTGISLYSQTKILPVIYYLFFVISLYLLSREITHDQGKTLLIMAFGSILAFQYETAMLAPSIQGFLLFPFIIYLFYKTRISKNQILEYSILFIIFLILIPFFHPGEVTFFLISIFAIIFLSARIYKRISKNISKNDDDKKLESSLNKNSLTIISLLLITWIGWFTSYSSFFDKIGQIVSWFTNEEGTSNIMEFSSILGSAHLTTINFIFLLMKTYGQYILFFTLTIIACIIILKRLLVNKTKIDLTLFTFAAIFVFFMIFILISLTNVVGVEFSRVLKYGMLISMILCGIFYYSFFNDNKKFKKIGMVFLIGFLMISGVIGIFNTYPSPLTESPNYQVSNMELTGETWFLNYNDPKLIVDNNINLYFGQILRFNDAIMGEKFDFIHKTIIYQGPDHFNYVNDSSLYGDTYNANFYYIDTTLLRISYPDLYPGYENEWRYTPSNYNKFDNLDPSVNKIYSDGDYNVDYIIGLNQTK